MNAVNYTIDISKIPRFLPSSQFLSFVEFYMYDENLKKIMFFKTKFEGNVVNLNPLQMKNVFKNPSGIFGWFIIVYA